MSTTLASNNPSNKEPQKASVFERLNVLNEEIHEGILNLSDEPKLKLTEEIEGLREQSFQSRAPEAEFAIRLYRKYADVANEIKDKSKNSVNNGDSFIHNAMLGEV